jgi:hypothetical protein
MNSAIRIATRGRVGFGLKASRGIEFYDVHNPLGVEAVPKGYRTMLNHIQYASISISICKLCGKGTIPYNPINSSDMTRR